jgi:hypothetical protein
MLDGFPENAVKNASPSWHATAQRESSQVYVAAAGYSD